MPLPQFYKVIVVNNSGATVTFNNGGRFNLKMTGWKWNPAAGDIVYSQLDDDDLGFEAGGSVAAAGEVLSTQINNTVNEFVGLQLQLEVTHDEGTAADGTFDLYLSGGDTTGELPSDATGYDDAVTNKLQFIGSLTWHPAGVDDQVMRSSVINL